MWVSPLRTKATILTEGGLLPSSPFKKWQMRVMYGHDGPPHTFFIIRPRRVIQLEMIAIAANKVLPVLVTSFCQPRDA